MSSRPSRRTQAVVYLCPPQDHMEARLGRGAPPARLHGVSWTDYARRQQVLLGKHPCFGRSQAQVKRRRKPHQRSRPPFRRSVLTQPWELIATNISLSASGDLRNVVKSIGSVSGSYVNKISVFVNDMDFEVVARNLIITLICLMVPDRSEATQCALHLWYSALIRKSDIEILTSRILPMIEDVNSKISSKAADTMLGKTWTIGKNVCRVELSKQRWGELALYVQETTGLSAHDAQSIRAAVTLAPQRKDYRDRWLFSLQPVHRLGGSRFFDEGILLPFGISRAAFVVPNP